MREAERNNGDSLLSKNRFKKEKKKKREVCHEKINRNCHEELCEQQKEKRV